MGKFWHNVDVKKASDQAHHTINKNAGSSGDFKSPGKVASAPDKVSIMNRGNVNSKLATIAITGKSDSPHTTAHPDGPRGAAHNSEHRYPKA